MDNMTQHLSDTAEAPASNECLRTASAVGMGDVERLNLVANLELIGRRLTDMESKLAAKSSGSSKENQLLDLLKVALGGWPAFGLLFIILFYVPIRDAINTIPQKVKDAEEIGVLGVSLKTTIRAEAERIGALQLSEVLPNLSAGAIEFLLRGVAEQNSLISYSLDSKDPNLVTAFYIPSKQTLDALRELEAKKLITIRIGPSTQDRKVSDLEQELASLQKRYPSSLELPSYYTDRIRLKLLTPVRAQPLNLSWQQTDLGRSAVSIILKAVATQLAPKVPVQSTKAASAP